MDWAGVRYGWHRPRRRVWLRSGISGPELAARATTTARVSDLPLSRDDVITAVAAYYESAGYAPLPPAELEYEVDEMLDIAATWNVGAIMERPESGTCRSDGILQRSDRC